MTGLLLPLALVVLASPGSGSTAAFAAAADGPLAVLPAAGTDATALTIVTGAPCPAGSNLQARITGAGFPAAGQNIVGNSPLTAYEHTRTGGLVIPVSLVLRDIANLPAQAVQYAGTYQITVTCRDRVRVAALGSFTGTLAFSDPHTYQAHNPVVATEVAPMDVTPGTNPLTGQAPGPGATPTPAPTGSAAGAATGSAGGAGTTTASSLSPARSTWARWAGLLVLCLGGAGLLLSGVTAVRRKSPAAP